MSRCRAVRPWARGAVCAAALVLLAACGATVDGTPSGLSGSAVPSGSSGSASSSAPPTSDPSVSVPFATGGASSSSGGGRTVGTDDFELTLPSGWTSSSRLETGIVAVYLGPTVDGFTINTNMAREPAPGADLNTYRARTLANLQTQLPISDLSETRSLTVDGEDAVTYDFRSTIQNKDFKQGQVVVLHDGYGFVFTYSASIGTYDEFAAQAASMVTSLRWK